MATVNNEERSVSVSEILKNLPKPNKNKKIAVEHLRTDDSVQIRTHSGETVFGVTLNISTYREQGLLARIIHDGEILVPLMVWQPVKEKEDYIVLRGNTRLLCAKTILADKDSPQSLVNNVKALECQVYIGITLEQAKALVNDQDQTRYNRVDYINWVWKKIEANPRINFKDVVRDDPNFYAEFIGTTMAKNKLLEYQQEKDVSKRDTILTTWARGTLDQYIMSAYKLGQRVRKAVLLTAAKDSGLLKEGAKQVDGSFIGRDEHPEFDPRAKDLKATRISALIKVLNDFGNNLAAALPMLNDMMDRYAQEDKGEAAKEKPSLRLTVSQLETQRNQVASKAAKCAFDIAAGNIRNDAMEIYVEAGRQEMVMEWIKENINSIKVDTVAEVLAFVLKAGSKDELKVLFAKFMN